MNQTLTILPFDLFSTPCIPSSCARPEHWCITADMKAMDFDEYAADEIDPSVPQWECVCVAKVRQGKPEAFNPLVQQYSKRIYVHLYCMVNNREEAEDLTQETFVRAYRKLDSYDTTKPFRNWLYAIATNIARNAARARNRRIPSISAHDALNETLMDSQESQAQNARELNEHLSLAVNQLPDPLPVLIHLHYQEGFTIREAAQVLGMTENAAKVALHRARKTLRTLLLKDEA